METILRLGMKMSHHKRQPCSLETMSEQRNKLSGPVSAETLSDIVFKKRTWIVEGFPI